MKKLIVLIGLIGNFTCLAQEPIGSVAYKNGGVFYSNGHNIFITGFKNNTVTATCLNTLDNSLKEYEFPKGGSNRTVTKSQSVKNNSNDIAKAQRAVSVFLLMGQNYLYQIEQSSDRPKNGLYDHLTIVAWNGKDAAEEYVFPDRLMGSKIRYSIANDEYIYFLLDRALSGFSESKIYATPHLLLRFNRKTSTLSTLNYNLPDNENNPFTSFWFPLRIENEFTEWYRTKKLNDKFIYEIKRINIDGLLTLSKDFTSSISTKFPEHFSEPPKQSTNLYYTSDAFITVDTATKKTHYSLLNLAPLHYSKLAQKYFTTTKVVSYGETAGHGAYIMVIENDLDLHKSYEFGDFIKNFDLMAQLPKFMNTSLQTLFNNDGTFYFNVQYLNYKDKIVAQRNHEYNSAKLNKGNFDLSLNNIKSDLYPGFSKDKEIREKIKGVKPEDFDNAYYLFTGNGMFYYFPSRKEKNIFFIKL